MFLKGTFATNSVRKSEGQGGASENVGAGKSLAIPSSITPSPWKVVIHQENQVTGLCLCEARAA